jgi:hypothetical protein
MPAAGRRSINPEVCVQAPASRSTSSTRFTWPWLSRLVWSVALEQCGDLVAGPDPPQRVQQVGHVGWVVEADLGGGTAASVVTWLLAPTCHNVFSRDATSAPRTWATPSSSRRARRSTLPAGPSGFAQLAANAGQRMVRRAHHGTGRRPGPARARAVRVGPPRLGAPTTLHHGVHPHRDRLDPLHAPTWFGPTPTTRMRSLRSPGLDARRPRPGPARIGALRATLRISQVPDL